MTESWTCTILGKPIAQARPRFARRGKFVKTYNPQETEAGKVYLEIRQQWGKNKPLDGPLKVWMTFCFPITKGSKKEVADMINGITRHTKKPDLTNLGKFYEDVMNGLVFLDDKQICEIELDKAYAQEPQTIITVEW